MPSPKRFGEQRKSFDGNSYSSDAISTLDSSLESGTSVFTNAHHFTIGTAYLVDNSNGGAKMHTEEERRAEEKKQAKALKNLAANGMPSAMLDSKERVLAPRCNEDTRQQLRIETAKWEEHQRDERRLLWISGPVGVGKSALAQTVAEDFKAKGLLGAAFFFSQPNDCRDPDVVIPTIAYELALILPGYLGIVTRVLANDPLLFDKSHRRQFNDLIVTPIRTLIAKQQYIAPRSLVIILDGLDECKDHTAQREFVEMIGQHARSEVDSRILWIICSRPEPNLKVAFSSADCKATCLQWSLDIDDEEARKDAIRILQTGFANLRNEYPDQLSEDWPTESQIRYIADRASGHLGYVSFLIRFIGDKHYEDPSGQLEVSLRSLEGTSDPENPNPLHMLDSLYTHILLSIPEPVLLTTLRILGVFILYGNTTLTALLLANFLDLDRATFYRALLRLHSVLYVPPAPEAGNKCLQVYHASFSDYLRDPVRSGRFVINEGAVHLDVAVQGLRWLNYCGKRKDHRSLPKPKWIVSHADKDTVIESLCTFAFTPCWRACVQVPEQSLAPLIAALRIFDFDIYYIRPRADSEAFVDFIRWLFSLGADHPCLATVDAWTTGSGAIDMEGKTGIYHHNADPHRFVVSLIKDATPAEKYRILLRLGTDPAAVFWFTVSKIGYSYFVDVL